MNRHLFASAAFLLLLLPQAGAAQGTTATTMFDRFFDEALDARLGASPSKAIVDFIIAEMEHWHGDGIILSDTDIQAAIDWQLDCAGKTNLAGEPIDFNVGSQAEGDGCLSLQQDIVSLVIAEQEADQLGSDLLAAANGSELSVADEPHRPVLMGGLSLLVKRVWSGTGVAVVPWDGTGNGAVGDLEATLNSLTPEDLDKAVIRYHFGYYRDQRESDPRFQGPPVDDVGEKLKAIADALQIVDDPANVGEFAVPNLQVPNIGFWARGDDVGLQFVAPGRFIRLTVEQAGGYPVIVSSPAGDKLAYPFEYEGSSAPTDDLIMSPLCSRTVGRFGYLCRSVPAIPENCTNTDPDKITLVQCSKTVKQTGSGPSVCEGLRNLYTDDGTPLIDPNNPGHLNPALTPADARTICNPDYKVLYQDDIGSHSCYIGQCLALSMSGHSLVPNRNPVVTNETTSPWQSCMRADPQLGLYTEAVTSSPFPLPAYLGHMLVRQFDHEYCLKNGDAPHAVTGECAYKTDQTAGIPPLLQSLAVTAILQNAAAVSSDQESFLELATGIGTRAALDQTIVIERKLYAGVTQFVQQMAGLFNELKRAPVTQTACPWTGPFTEYGR